MNKTGKTSSLSHGRIHHLPKISAVLFALFLHSFLYAQILSPTVISTAGGFDVAGGVSLSSTIGQPSAIETFTAAPLILTQGFQQPEEEVIVVIIQVLKDESLEVSAFPNPASNLLKIQYHHPMNKSARAHVIDIRGSEVIPPFDLNSDELASLNISSLAAGIYFLNVREETKSITIKVIKLL